MCIWSWSCALAGASWTGLKITTTPNGELHRSCAQSSGRLGCTAQQWAGRGRALWHCMGSKLLFEVLLTTGAVVHGSGLEVSQLSRHYIGPLSQSLGCGCRREGCVGSPHVRGDHQIRQSEDGQDHVPWSCLPASCRCLTPCMPVCSASSSCPGTSPWLKQHSLSAT